MGVEDGTACAYRSAGSCALGDDATHSCFGDAVLAAEAHFGLTFGSCGGSSLRGLQTVCMLQEVARLLAQAQGAPSGGSLASATVTLHVDFTRAGCGFSIGTEVYRGDWHAL